MIILRLDLPCLSILSIIYNYHQCIYLAPQDQKHLQFLGPSFSSLAEHKRQFFYSFKNFKGWVWNFLCCCKSLLQSWFGKIHQANQDLEEERKPQETWMVAQIPRSTSPDLLQVQMNFVYYVLWFPIRFSKMFFYQQIFKSPHKIFIKTGLCPLFSVDFYELIELEKSSGKNHFQCMRKCSPG